MSAQQEETLDITPTPRVLRMLGEVDLSPARCFAEFIDNSLDEGIDGQPGRGDNSDAGDTLRIEISTPSMYVYEDDYENAEISIRDDGPGMSKADLEKNLKAGYSGKDPVNEMGLFGMGFNIATARLGDKTVVRTTRTGDEKWAVATIDFRDLERQGNFEIEVQHEDKEDPSDHGTEILISQLNEISKTLRRKQNMPKDLGDWYTPVLERENVKILLNGDELSSRPACIWDKERSVEIGGEECPAYIGIEEKVGEGYYCKDCWGWWDEQFLTFDEKAGPMCPSCDGGGDIVHREQQVWGWLGIQRFFDEEHFGIDLVRNGRVIEKHDKSLFYWENPEGVMEKEYPIDSTHWGGRIVGELHIDFVPVTNTKDSFKKSNDRWKKVRNAIRGEGPLRPNIARRHNYEPNSSPLAKLHKGYRTASDVGKKRLVPGEVKENGEVEGDNSRPKKWAEKFWDGEEEYQDDSKWWELVERAERALRDSEGGSTEENPTSEDGDTTDGSNDGFDLSPGGNDSTELNSEDGDQDSSSDPDQHQSSDHDLDDEGADEPTIEAERDEQVSGTYGLDEIDEPDIKFNVYRLTDGEMENGPVKVEREAWDEKTVTYDPLHEFFTEFGHEPIDSVLLEAASTFHTRMDDAGSWRQTRLFADLQTKYCDDHRISPRGLAARASEQLKLIKQRVAKEEFDLGEYEIDDTVEEEIREAVWEMTGEGGEKVSELLGSSAYLNYASHSELIKYFKANPEQFFDGTVWSSTFSGLGSTRLQEQSVRKFTAFLDDVVMLATDAAEYDMGGLRKTKRIELERAAKSLQMLEAEAVTDDE